MNIVKLWLMSKAVEPNPELVTLYRNWMKSNGPEKPKETPMDTLSKEIVGRLYVVCSVLCFLLIPSGFAEKYLPQSFLVVIVYLFSVTGLGFYASLILLSEENKNLRRFVKSITLLESIFNLKIEEWIRYRHDNSSQMQTMIDRHFFKLARLIKSLEKEEKSILEVKPWHKAKTKEVERVRKKYHSDATLLRIVVPSMVQSDMYHFNVNE